MFKRFIRAIKSMFGGLISSMEDPKLILEQNIRDLNDQIPQMNENIATVKANLLMLQKEAKRNEKQIAELTSKIKSAIQANRDDIAEGYALQLEKAKETISHTRDQLAFAERAYEKALKVKKVFMREKDRKIQEAKEALRASERAEWQSKIADTLEQFEVGAVGKEVQKQFDAFGLAYVSYDPPRAKRDSSFHSVGLEELLNCDVLTFHVPLTKTGVHCTFHWLDDAKLNSHSYKLIINAARGGVIDEQVVLRAMEMGRIQDVIIDVWENEPNFNSILAQKAFISTPHIAGYSEQAKLKATQLLVEKFGEKFDLAMNHPVNLFKEKNLEIADLDYSLQELLLRLNPLKEYDVALRDLISRPDKEPLFKKLRVDRPYRYEYPYLRISETLLNKFEELKLLGLRKTN